MTDAVGGLAIKYPFEITPLVMPIWLEEMLPKRHFCGQNPEEEGRQTAKSPPQAWRSSNLLRGWAAGGEKAQIHYHSPFPDAFRRSNLLCLGTERGASAWGRLKCLSWQPVTCLGTHEHTRSFISAPEKFHQSLAEAELQIEQIFARARSRRAGENILANWSLFAT